MRIEIASLEFKAIIGLLDFERVTKQRVIVDLELDYIYSKDKFINYATLATLIKDNIKSRQYTLLEDALIELKDEIYSKYSNIDRLKLKISKPDILDDCIVSLSQEYTFEPTSTLPKSTTN
jgi:dihydroneopterin aldolase